MTRRRVHVGLPIPALPAGWSTVAVGIADGFRATALEPVLYLPHAAVPLPPGLPVARPLPVALPPRLAWRIDGWLRRRAQEKLVAAVRREGPGALVWLWPEMATGIIRELRAAGAVIVREMINTRRRTALGILDGEHARLGLPPQHWITPELVRAEDEDLALVDHLVSPSESVDESLVASGWPAGRIIRSTFAWNARDFAEPRSVALPGRGPHALFLGTVGIRKGVHLALAAWERAGVDGTLVVVGDPEAGSEAMLPPYRDRPDIAWLPFQKDLAGLYRAADYMFFPSLEEGAPLVCYQAAGCGLPILTSPMGRGRIIEHEVSGLVVDPHDADGLVSALRRMAGDPALRARLAAVARARADRLTWPAVAAERAEAILARIG